MDRIEVELLLGGSLYLYQYGDVWKIIDEDFPDTKKWKTSLLVEGDCLVKMSKSVGTGLLEISTILDNSRPDLVVSIADRFETMATAVAASYTNIPLAHIQGGEVSGTIDDKVRNAITQLADYHFPATCDAADRIANMKMQDMERIWAYGCPSMDVMLSWGVVRSLYDSKRNGTGCRSALAGLNTALHMEINRHGVGDDIDFSRPYIIVMMHPDTTGEQVSDDHMTILQEALNNFGCQKIVFWNNIDPGGSAISKSWRMSQHNYWKDKIRFIRHVPADVFGALLINATMIVGNSSAGIREATFLGTPSISVGERQKGREHGNNVMFSSFCYSDLMSSMNNMRKAAFVPDDMYGDGNAGFKIANQLEDIVNGRCLG